MAMALGWEEFQANKKTMRGEDTDGKKLVGDGVLKTKTAGEGREFLLRVEQVTWACSFESAAEYCWQVASPTCSGQVARW